jgi:acetyl-CoA synthetase
MVNTPVELIETLKLLHQGGALSGNKLVSLSCSGGEASLIADLCEKTSLVFEPFSNEQHRRISSTLTELVTVGNPFDYHTFMWGDRTATANTFTQVMSGPQDATLLILDTPPRSDHDSRTWVTAAQSIGDAANTTNRRGVIIATVPECVTDAVRAAANEANIVVLQGLQDAVVALDAAAWLATRHANEAPARVEIATSTKLINEADAKLLLVKNGVNVPSGKKCSRDAVLETANQIGYPITLKGLGLAHKSESGAVKVGLQNELQIVEAISSMQVSISEFLVEQTVTNVVAEILVSVRRDAPVGWLIILGAGGIYTELWRDTTYLLAPVSDSAIKQALAKLRIFPLLDGFRGKPAGNLKSLIELIQNVISAAMNNDLVEIELNPVLVTPEIAIAVDALMIASI